MTESLLTVDNDLLGDDLFIKPKKKKKILMLSDHPLAPSGVGVQARFLIEGLVNTGNYSFRCLGGAIKHQDYRTIQVNEDFIVKPVDGFGTHDMMRSLLITEKPDALLIFTDPRQFIWLWEIEDEIHQVCPITYWHVWDNDPYPAFNRPWYESTDLINCLSYKTYELVKPHFPEKTEYIPHAFPKHIYFEIPKEEVDKLAVQNFGPKAGWFKALWVNRNATRKLPADVLDGWKLFLDKLEAKHGHRNAVMIMHTDPNDPEGPNLLAVAEMMGLQNNVWFSTDKLGFDRMNILHNLVDTVVNVSKNEGFGLSTLVSLQVGKPIITLKTGGETRQVIDHRNGNELGVGLEPIKRCMVGSQLVPYIYEDFAGTEELADAFLKVFEYTPEEKEDIKIKAKDYVDYEFNMDKIIKRWDETLTTCIDNFKAGNTNTWSIQKIEPIIPGKGEEAIIDRNPNRLAEVKQAQIAAEMAQNQRFVQSSLVKPESTPTEKKLEPGAKRVLKTAAPKLAPKKNKKNKGK